MGGRAQVPCTRFTLIVGMPQAGALNFLSTAQAYTLVLLILPAIVVWSFLVFFSAFYQKSMPAKPRGMDTHCPVRAS